MLIENQPNQKINSNIDIPIKTGANISAEANSVITKDSLIVTFNIYSNYQWSITYCIKKDGTAVKYYTTNSHSFSISYEDTSYSTTTDSTYNLFQMSSNSSIELASISTHYTKPFNNFSIKPISGYSTIALKPQYTKIRDFIPNFNVFKKVSTSTTYTKIGSTSNIYIDTNVTPNTEYNYKFQFNNFSTETTVVQKGSEFPYLGQKTNTKYIVTLTDIIDNSHPIYNVKTFIKTVSKGINTTYQQTIPIDRYRDSSKINEFIEGSPYYLVVKDNKNNIIDSEIIFLKSKRYDTKYKTSLNLTFVGQEYILLNTFNYSFPTKNDLKWLQKNSNNGDKDNIDKYINTDTQKTGVYDGLSIDSIFILLGKYIEENFSFIVKDIDIVNHSSLLTNPTAIPPGFPYTSVNGSKVSYALTFDYLTPLYNIVNTLAKTYSIYPSFKLIPIANGNLDKGAKLIVNLYTFNDSANNYPLYQNLDINSDSIVNISKSTSISDLRNKAVVFGKQMQVGEGIMAIATQDNSTTAGKLGYTVPIGVKSDYIISQDMAESLAKNLIDVYSEPNITYNITLTGYLPNIVTGISKLNLHYSGDNTQLQSEYNTDKTVYISSVQSTIKQNEITTMVTQKTRQPLTYLDVVNYEDSKEDNEQVILYASELVNAITNTTILEFNDNSNIRDNYTINNQKSSNIYTKNGVHITPNTNIMKYISYVDFIKPTTNIQSTINILNSNTIYFTSNKDIIDCYFNYIYVSFSIGQKSYSGYIKRYITKEYTDFNGDKHTFTDPIAIYVFNSSPINLPETSDNIIQNVYLAEPFTSGIINIKQYFTVGSQGKYTSQLISEKNDNGSVTINEEKDIIASQSYCRIIENLDNPNKNNRYIMYFTPLNNENRISLQSYFQYNQVSENNVTYSLYVKMQKLNGNVKKESTAKTISFNFNKKIWIKDKEDYYKSYLYNTFMESTIEQSSYNSIVKNESLKYTGSWNIADDKNMISYSNVIEPNTVTTIIYIPTTQRGYYTTTGSITLHNNNVPMILSKTFIGNQKWNNGVIGIGGDWVQDISSVDGEKLIEEHNTTVSNKIEIHFNGHCSINWQWHDSWFPTHLIIGAELQSPYSYDKNITLVSVYVNSTS